jgi:hypothetical protein
MNIYLDIDGVLLVSDKQIANYSKDFIKYLVENHNVYWLTTHCRGNALYTSDLLKKFFDKETMEYIQKIKETYWEVNKTEGIDFSKPFLWFDDDLFKEEREVLVKNNCLDSWVEIDLAKDEHQLKKYLEI